jgi:hypothetical protein
MRFARRSPPARCQDAGGRQRQQDAEANGIDPQPIAVSSMDGVVLD